MHQIEQVIQTSEKEEFKFSIIIPTWNNLDFLKHVVGSIRKNSRFKHQIILHINEGIDGTKAWVDSQKDIDYTWSKENIGICYPLNIARQLVKTKYLVYMNDDMYVCPNWDVPFDKEIQKRQDHMFFLSGTLIESQSNNPCVIQADYGKSLSDFNEQQFLDTHLSHPFNDWHGATWPINLVHVNLWDMVGGYSVEYTPGFYSDPDFSKKLWDIGVRYFKGLSDSRVYHFPSQSTKRIKKANKGRKTFLLKWGITSSYFFKHYLKMGTPFSGELQEVKENKSFLHKLKSAIEIFKQD